MLAKSGLMPAPCSPVCLVPLIALEDASFKPLADRPQDSRIGDPVRHQSQQPLVVNRVEKAANVRVKHPEHLPGHQRRMQGVQRVMRAAARPKA